VSRTGIGVRAAFVFLFSLYASSTVAQGTAGDVVLDGSQPGMATYGVFLRPKTSNPNIGAKLAGNTSAETFVVFNSANTALLTVRGNGNTVLGPNRTGILARLEVVATNATTDSVGTPTSYGGILLTNDIDTNLVLRTLGSGLAQISTDKAGRALSLGSGSFNEAMRIDPVQNVGIGTPSPTNRLHVEGGLQVGKHLTLPGWVNVSAPNVPGFAKLVTPIVHNENNFFLIHIRGYRYNDSHDVIDIRCGGYAHPGSTLVSPRCETEGTALPVEIGTEIPAGAAAPVVVIRIGIASTVWYFGHFTAEYTGLKAKAAADFSWVVATSDPGTGFSGNTNNVMVDDMNGTLTLGAAGTGPNRLTVNGSATVTGNITATGTISGVIQATYQDIAEWVPTTVDVAPATVVVLNGDKVNEVMPSYRSYDTSVAGVVSAKPGVVLGAPGESKAQIATYGRVKVRVDATRAPIRVGDLLVTSDKPGTAMKSIAADVNGLAMHRPGTIIGKALEPLPAGEGEILVLLSLQ